MTRNSIVKQMMGLETLFLQILGKIPTYMRAPFLEVDRLVLSTMAELGYHVIGASIDTKDYENDRADLIHLSLEKFRSGIDAGGSIVLSHDIHYQTVEFLTQAILDDVRRRGLVGTLDITPSFLLQPLLN